MLKLENIYLDGFCENINYIFNENRFKDIQQVAILRDKKEGKLPSYYFNNIKNK